MKKLTILLSVCFLIALTTVSMAAKPHWGAEGTVWCNEDNSPVPNYPAAIEYEIKWNESSTPTYFSTTVYTNSSGAFFHKHFVVPPTGTLYTVEYVNISVTANNVERVENDAPQGITNFGHWKPYCQ